MDSRKMLEALKAAKQAAKIQAPVPFVMSKEEIASYTTTTELHPNTLANIQANAMECDEAEMKEFLSGDNSESMDGESDYFQMSIEEREAYARKSNPNYKWGESVDSTERNSTSQIYYDSDESMGPGWEDVEEQYVPPLINIENYPYTIAPNEPVSPEENTEFPPLPFACSKFK